MVGRFFSFRTGTGGQDDNKKNAKKERRKGRKEGNF